LDDRTTPGSYNLASKYTELVGKKGTYPILYSVHHSVYATNVVTVTAPFVVTIIDPCDEPVSVTALNLTAQEYTITDKDAVSYIVPVYTVDPAWCAITYTYSITDQSGDPVTQATLNPLLQFNDEPAVR
jgi:hypothetical protein